MAHRLVMGQPGPIAAGFRWIPHRRHGANEFHFIAYRRPEGATWFAGEVVEAPVLVQGSWQYKITSVCKGGEIKDRGLPYIDQWMVAIPDQEFVRLMELEELWLDYEIFVERHGADTHEDAVAFAHHRVQELRRM